MGIFDAASLPSGPTSKQINTSDISSWAQPYISDYLTKSQTLANQAPTAFQNQVASSAQNLGTPEQFGQGSNLLNQAGQGQLNTTGQALGYGQQGVGIGALGLGYGMNAGANYANQATNPYAVGAYMNPYIQQSLAPQLGLLNQQQQLASQDINAKAVGQGAFGGNRATLAQGLNAQNFDLARQQAIGQGYNQAFQNAQQAQQFGANLGLQGAQMGVTSGLQGLGTALQGVQGAQQGYTGATQAGVGLGNIGAQQGQYDLSKLALQNQIANQQYMQPFQQQQFMQSMLSGLPITSQTTQGFQAPPNALSQMTGLAGSLITGGALANKLGLLPKFGGGNNNTNNTNPYAASLENNGAQLGEVWGSPGTIDTSYGTGDAYGNMTSDEISNMQIYGLAEGGSVKSYASGGIVSLAMKKALKG